MKRLILLFMALLPLAASAQSGEMARRMELGEALYHKGQYVASAREFALAKEAAAGANGVERELITFFHARAAYMAGSPEATLLLGAYCRDFRDGVHYAEAAMMLGDKMLGSFNRADTTILRTSCKWTKVRSALAVVAAYQLSEANERMLSRELRDEYRFKLGYARMLAEEYDKVAESLVKIDSASIYFTHAQYVMAYSDYASGRYDEARKLFQTAVQAEEYRAALPFYLMQLDFAQGHWRAVIDNSARIMVSADNQQVTEAERMVGISMYRVKNWRGAALMLNKYRDDNDGFLTREESYLLGTANYMSGSYGEAETALRNVIAGDDEITQNASYMLGGIYASQNEKELAKQSFIIASSMSYNADIKQDALFNYCKLSYETGGNGEFNEAVNMMKNYLVSYPNSPHKDEIGGYLVAAYYNSHDFDSALRAVSEIKNPSLTTRLAIQKITYSRAVERFRVDDLDAAMALLEQSKTQRADAKYTALADLWGGEILYRRGSYDAAIAKYEAYLKVAPMAEPEVAQARYNIGYAYFNQKKWAAAKSSFDAFLTQYKSNVNFTADALSRLGDIEFAQKSYWKAIDFYGKAAAEQTNERYYAQFRRAVMLGLVDRVQRKIESLNDIISSNTGDYRDAATFELGRTYISQERYADAAHVFETFAQAFPTSPYYGGAAVNQGLAYRNLGDNERAEQAYKRVLDRERGTQAAADALAGIYDIYAERGDVEGYVRYAQSVESKTITEDATAMMEQIAERERAAAEMARQENERARVERERADYEAIQREFAADNFDAAERLIKSYKPQSDYLRAKALLTLGDIYVRRNDTFLARTTYQSVANNYPDKNDGIVAEAQARINNLK